MSKKKPDKTVETSESIYSRSELIETVETPESVYNRNELIEAASSFGVKPEVIVGALKLAGKDTMTKAEAEKAIKDFLKRRV